MNSNGNSNINIKIDGSSTNEVILVKIDNISVDSQKDSELPFFIKYPVNSMLLSSIE